MQLRRKDFDLKNDIISMTDEKAKSAMGKKGGRYEIPLCSHTKAKLESYLQTLQPDDLVVWGGYTSRQGENAPTVQMIGYRVQPIIDRIIEGNETAERSAKLTLHTFRSFIISWIQNEKGGNAAEALARALTNHSQPKRDAFSRYNKTTLEQIRPHLERAMEFLKAEK